MDTRPMSSGRKLDSDQEFESLANRLENSADYRIVRRLQQHERYHSDAEKGTAEIRRGLFLDTETTGLDPQTDKIIELALIPFEFASDGRIFRVFEGLDALQDPGCPIPEVVVRLTGITDEMVAGQQIDHHAVESLVTPVSIIIAHNARFDRPFAENLIPVFKSKAWGCSASEVPWQEEGIESSKLEYVAYRFGFFYGGHRASSDCRAAIHILAQTLPQTGIPVLKALLDQARKSACRIWALDSPYEAKDRLKIRGYRWNSGEDGRYRSWYVDIEETEKRGELEFLRQKIYGRDVDLPMMKINAFNRYSDRI